MKKKKILKPFLFLVLVLFPSCISDEVVTTRFRPDGTLVREVEFFSDREQFDPGELATPVDSTWKIRVVRDTVDTSRYRVRASKEYAGVEELNADYRNIPTTLEGVKREVSFEKKFMWFYTFYYYQETVYTPFSGVPVRNYLTEEELAFLQRNAGRTGFGLLPLSDIDEPLDASDLRYLPPSLQGEDTAALKDYYVRVQQRFRTWMADAFFHLWWQGMEKVVTEHPGGAFTPARLTAERDTLRRLYRKVFFNLLGDDLLSQYFRERFGLSPDTLMTKYAKVFERYNDLAESNLLFTAYENRVVMPGKVFDTNADEAEDEVLSWWVGAVRFLPGDMDMFAASRVPNYWAWAVALMIVIFAVMMFIIPKKKR